MARHRFYTPPSSIACGHITLDAGESHHLQHVLRLRPGATVCVFDGVGNEYLCRLEGFGHAQAQLTVLEQTQPAVESPLPLTLAQGVAKGDKFDFIVQKTTELGVRRIIPLITSHTASTGARFFSQSRLERWRRIALEATKQCGRTRLTEITGPLEWSQFLAQLPPPALFFSERGGQSLSDLRSQWGEQGAPACVLIGPEGGWQETEIEAARAVGAIAVSLGPRILRTETAAIVAVGLVQHLWGDMQ